MSVRTIPPVCRPAHQLNSRVVIVQSLAVRYCVLHQHPINTAIFSLTTDFGQVPTATGGGYRVMLEADGEKFFADGTAGSYTNDLYFSYLKQSYAHNMVCIDRTGQFPVMGERIAHGLSPSTDIIWAAGQGGTDRFKFIEGWIDAHSEGYTGVQLDRSVTFVRPDYFIVRDTAVSPEQKRAELLWHALSRPELRLPQTGEEQASFRSAPKAPFITSNYFKARYREGSYQVDLRTHAFSGGGADLIIPRRRAALALHVVKPQSGRIGWGPAANPHDEKGERTAFLISVEAEQTGMNQSFITVLEPFSPRSPRTIRTCRVEELDSGLGDAVIIDREHNRDLCLYAEGQPQRIGFDRFSVRAGIGHIRLRSKRLITTAAAGSVTEIVFGEESLFTASTPVDFVSLENWYASERSVHIHIGDNATSVIRVSRRPTSVWLNATQAEFEYDSSSGELKILRD